jgi:hypothetical protein
MRCPECNHNHKYKEGRICGKCGYRFVFNPKTDILYDGIIRQMIRRLSDNDQHYFTSTPLAIEICQYSKKEESRRTPVAVYIALVILIICLLTELWFIGVIIFAVAIISIKVDAAAQKVSGSFTQTASNSFTQAESAIQRYHKDYPIKQLVDGKAFVKTPVIGQSTADDVFAPERILVVEHDDMVDMLIRNRFHQNTKTVVVSQTGYPNFVFTACQTFLTENPKIPVQILHDASSEGFEMRLRLCNDAKWQFARDNFVDIGLSRDSFIADEKFLLPWVSESNQDVFFNDNYHYQEMRDEGRKVPLDYTAPKPFLNALSAAVVSGTLLLVALEKLTEDNSYEDYG